jgi:hypothetical protein
MSGTRRAKAEARFAISGSFKKNLAEIRKSIRHCPVPPLIDVTGSVWPPLVTACMYFGLDPHKPSDRDLVLFALVSAAFEGAPRKGAPKKSLDEDFELGIEWLRVVCRLHPEPVSDKKAAEEISQRVKSISVGRIRQRLPAARRAVEWIGCLLNRR